MTNGKYKSCLHRALVNREKERRSLVYFVVPNKEKTVKPPEELIEGEKEERNYPDFKWIDFFTFTQYHYRPNTHTLPNFIQWFLSSKSNNNDDHSLPSSKKAWSLVPFLIIIVSIYQWRFCSELPNFLYMLNYVSEPCMWFQ